MNAPVTIHQHVDLWSCEAEQQLLGNLLLSSAHLPQAVRAGGERLFHDPVHAQLFAIMARMEARGDLVTPVTVKAAVGDLLDELGGAVYIARLASASISAYAIPSYIELLSGLASKRELRRALEDAQRGLLDPEAKVDDVAASLEGRLVSIVDTAAPERAVSMLRALSDAVNSAHRAWTGETEDVVRSGLGALDAIVPGFHRGELTLLGGRPSMGKTALGIAIALNAARAGHAVGIASLEMTPEALAARVLSIATAEAGCAVPYIDQRRGNLSEQQMRTLAQAGSDMRDLPITFLPRSYADIGALAAGAKHIRRATGLKLLIVDYAQLLRAEGRSRYEQITAISIALKALAVQLDIPVIALSQLSRDLEKREDKRPQLSDLRESGQLEQDADNVLFCYRDEYYLERDQPGPMDAPDDHAEWQARMMRARGHLEVIVAKQRMGPIGTANLRFAAATNSVWSEVEQ